MATFSQHHVDGLDLSQTPLQYLMKQFPNNPEQVCPVTIFGDVSSTDEDRP